jgi:hypothetical protein
MGGAGWRSGWSCSSGSSRSDTSGSAWSSARAAKAALIDEFMIALSPVLFGSGIPLFEGVDAGRVALEPIRAEPTQRVTHLTYAVLERPLSRPQRSLPRSAPR